MIRYIWNRVIGIFRRDSRKPNKGHLKGKFSHVWYDDLTETLFIYFKDIHIEDMDGEHSEVDMEFACLMVDPKSHNKIRQAFNKKKVEEMFL